MTLPEITPIILQLRSQVEAVALSELAFALIGPLLAMLLGIRIRQFLKKQSKRATMGTRFLRSASMLISPLLAIMLGLLSLALFKAAGTQSLLLLFVLKLSIAWFVIALVVLMGSQRTAGWFVALVIIPFTLLELFDVWDITVDALTELQFSIGSVKLNAYLIFKGVAAVIILQAIASGLTRAVDRQLARAKRIRASNRLLIMKIFQIVLYSIIIIVGMQMLGINMSALGVFGGAVGVGIGFGLQKIASNFISGIILLFEKAIEIGDLIEFADGTSGYVRQTKARYTLI